MKTVAGTLRRNPDFNILGSESCAGDRDYNGSQPGSFATEKGYHDLLGKCESTRRLPHGISLPIDEPVTVVPRPVLGRNALDYAADRAAGNIAILRFERWDNFHGYDRRGRRHDGLHGRRPNHNTLRIGDSKGKAAQHQGDDACYRDYLNDITARHGE